MNASDKAKRQLLEEIRVLRSRNAKLESICHEMSNPGDANLKSHTLQASQDNKELHNITPSSINECKIKKKMMKRPRITENLIIIGVVFAVFYWILESGVHTFIFHNGIFFDQILPSDANELWMRLVVCFILIWFSIYAQIIIKQLRRTKVKLQQSHSKLEIRVAERTAELTTTNEKLLAEITERKKNEGQIQKQNEFLYHVLESLTYPFLVIDANDYTVKVANSSAGIVMSSKKTTCYSLSHKLDRPCNESGGICPLQEIKKFGHAMTTEHVHIDRNGNPHHVEVHGYPIVDNKGDVTDIIEYSLDITDRKKTEEKLIENQAHLRSLVSELTMTEECERKNIAGLLHDELIQKLVMCKMRLDELSKSKILTDRDNSLDEIGVSIREMIRGARSLTFDLCSPVLYDIGLEAAIRDWLEREVDDKYDIIFEFTDDGQQRQFSEDLRVTLFRAVRELCMNVIKHSKAQKAKISIRSKNNNAEIIVEDNGGGITIDCNTSDSSERGGLGLFGIRERLGRFGAGMNIESGADIGTKIAITIPLNYEDNIINQRS